MKKGLFVLVLILSTITIFAQTSDPVVMTVNGNKIYKSEFEYIYNKNNNEDAIDKRSLEEYITLFTNFKLRVAEAEAQGLDTTAVFHKELNEYRTQLAKPYLTELVTNEELLLQSFNRTQELAELSAIFISYPQLEAGAAFNVLPADTLEAYKKAIEIRNKAVKGQNFENLVKEYSFDERAKQADRPGYLGWYSGLNLAPSLEEPIFATAAGKITMPIRTNQGYYLIKVQNKKPHPGEVNASHILITCPPDADVIQVSDALNKMNEIEQKLKEGAEFSELATEYSEDKGSAARGGDLSWFQFGQMVPEFNEMVFSMTEIGSVSQPVKTQFGYHIIKLLGKRPGATFDDLRGQLETKIERTGNFMALYQPSIDKLKAENSYSLNENSYNLLLKTTQNLAPTDSLYIAQFENNKETLFSLGDTSVSIADFIAYLKNNPRSYFNLSSEVLNERFEQFLHQNLMEIEDKSLESKHPDFKNLMQEYRDGILLFEVSNKEVWDKASNDTLGLADYFEKNKAKYAWSEPRWKGYVILAKDSKTKKKMRKETSKMTHDDAVKYLLDNYRVGDVSYVRIEKGLFTKGQNKFVDEVIFKTGKAERPEAFQDFFLLGTLLPNMPEVYTDVRGLVITDYQDHLEKEWLKSLNEKYPVVIYKDVINTIK